MLLQAAKTDCFTQLLLNASNLLPMSVVPRYLTEVTQAIEAKPKLMGSLTNLDILPIAIQWDLLALNCREIESPIDTDVQRMLQTYN